MTYYDPNLGSLQAILMGVVLGANDIFLLMASWLLKSGNDVLSLLQFFLKAQACLEQPIQHPKTF